MENRDLYGRKATLTVSRTEFAGNNVSAYRPASTIDLSDMHFKFRTAQQDVESPNNCTIRIYNLAQGTVDSITKFEYDRVVLQAGYAAGAFGVIFDGTIKQFKIGRENATDTYLDLLCADGDLAYNFAIVNKTLAAGSSPADRVKAAIDSMAQKGAAPGHQMSYTGGVLPRGKVLFGMARALLRQEAESQLASWSIDNGRINIIPLKGFKPGEAVVLTAQTGLIGLPEQTLDGVRAQSLLNPRIEVASLFKIDNASINRIQQQNGSTLPAPAFNTYAGIQNLAHVAADGLYRAFVVEHEGDTRGVAWYSHLVGLAVNPVSMEVRGYV